MLRWIQNLFERLIVRSAWLSGMYLAVAGRFAHESQRVLSGQLRHRGAGDDPTDGARYTLRRDTHRVEKGLVMRPRRPVFALDYIGEHLGALEQVATAGDDRDRELLQWACDVLGQYFDACQDGRLQGLRARFEAVLAATDHCPGGVAPYPRDTRKPDEGTLPRYEQLLSLAERRRSVRWFLPTPVPRELVDRALRVGLLAPSACNRQPFRFHILEDPARIAEVGAIPMGTRGWGHNIPMLIVAIGQQRAFFHDRDRHLIYIDGALAIMGFELALETLGLSSCSINWPAIPHRERAIQRALGLAPDETPIMLIAVGFADPEGGVPYSQKKAVSEARSYDSEPSA